MSATLPGGGPRPGNVPAAAAGPIGPVLERLDRAHPAAAIVLRACAFLDSDDIPVWLFGYGVDELPAPLVIGSRARVQAFAELTRSALARWTSPDGLSVDPVVQAAVRQQLAGRGRRGWAAGVVRLVAGAFPDESDDVATSANSARLVPHALAAVSHDEAVRAEPLATTRLLERVAANEQSRGRAVDACRLRRRSVVVAATAYGSRHPLVGHSVANLALTLQDLGRFPEACRNFERALAIAEWAYGLDDPDVAEHLANLAVALQDLGEPARARACLRRALRITEAAGGLHQPAAVSVLNNLGSVLADLGELAEAHDCFERALAVGEATLGPAHPVVHGIRANRNHLMRTPGPGA